MERPTVLIISDEADFSRQLCGAWEKQHSSPSFSVIPGRSSCDADLVSFDLAILGPIREPVRELTKSLQKSRRSVIQVSPLSAAAGLPGVMTVPQVEGWPELVVAIAKEVIDRCWLQAQLDSVSEMKAQLEREASLGRYMLEMRHSLNNALTSILGNSELMLLEPEQLAATAHQQLGTIRNMGMRMNEILQRFSSLQKELQLADEQARNKKVKSAAAGA